MAAKTDNPGLWLFNTHVTFMQLHDCTTMATGKTGFFEAQCDDTKGEGIVGAGNA